MNQLKRIWLACCLLGMLARPGLGDAPQTLRAAATGKFLIGAAVHTDLLNNPVAADIVGSQFDALTAETEFKPIHLEPEPGQFHFEEADRILAFAEEHHQTMIGHTLCWYESTPKWFFENPDGSPLPREKALANLKFYIDGVLGHFRGKVLGWDVVNEAIDDGGKYFRDTPAHRAIGDDYVLQAFEFAQAADPSVELYYNDYHVEQPAKRAKAIHLIQSLQAAGIHIHAIGIQGHWGMDTPDLKSISDSITAFNAQGLKVSFTELDINVLPAQWKGGKNGPTATGDNPYVSGLPDSVARKQADRYGSLFKLFVQHRSGIERVTFWGVSDGGSWLNNFPVHGRTNYPLLFDRDFKPKPAFDAVLVALRSEP